LDRKQQLSIVGCTGQSGAPPDIHCAVSGARHISRPLVPVAVDRWIRPLPSVRCTPDSPVLHPESACLWPLCADCPVPHRTVRCTIGYCTVDVRCTPRQPTVGACSSRPLDPTVAVCLLAHRTVRCYSQRAPVCGLSADYPVPHWTVRCTPDINVRCATRRWLTALILDFFADFFGLLWFLSIGLLCIFLCLLLRCCILIALVQFSSHPVNYNYKH
jgi:hypothetical protein